MTDRLDILMENYPRILVPLPFNELDKITIAFAARVKRRVDNTGFIERLLDL